jgi:hypothetical protein
VNYSVHHGWPADVGVPAGASPRTVASDPLGGLVSGLMTGLESSGSWQQVSDYAAVHCGSGNAP